LVLLSIDLAFDTMIRFSWWYLTGAFFIGWCLWWHEIFARPYYNEHAIFIFLSSHNFSWTCLE